jgi:ABC-type glycerol-3-phosphate transport system permease component
MKSAIGSVPRYIAIGIITVVVPFPIVWALLSSFRATSGFATLGFALSLESYQRILSGSYVRFGLGMYNSLVVASGTIIIALPLGLLAAYSLARFRFRGNRDIAFYILSTRFIPPIAVAIPIFLIMRDLSLLDTYPSIILMHTSLNLPLVVWMLRGFIMSVPVEIEEAAMIDGCSRLGALVRTVLPVLTPALATTAVFCLIFSWNDFMFALFLTYDKAATLPKEYSSLITKIDIPWGYLMAGTIVMIVVPLIVTIIIQRYMASALTWGAVKG